MKKILIFTTLLILLLTTQSFAKQMVVVDSYNIIDAKPGETTENFISVENPADSPATVEIWVQDWKTSSYEGQIIKSPVDGSGVLDQSLAPYLEIRSPREVTIPPREVRDIKFTTKVPKDKKGTYWTAIVVAQYMGGTTENDDSKDSEDQVEIVSRAAFFSKIIRSDTQNEDLKPWISYLSAPKFIGEDKKRLQFEATLENRGEVAFFFPCQLTIYEGLDQDKNPIAKVDGEEAIGRQAPFYLFPAEDLETKISVPVDLPPGVYTAKLKIMMERGEYAPVAWRQFRVEE
jgi:uncharacterized protein affecting Mg2+/Co2+ transport